MNDRIKLKDISLAIGSGITPRKDNQSYWEGGTIPWLKTEQLGEKNIYDTNEKITQCALDETKIKIFPQNTLSIAMYGEGKTRGNVSIMKKEMTTNQACCNIVISKEKADYEYVYYYLKTQYNQLRRLSSGVRKNLNSNDIKEFEIKIPSKFSVQQKIADVLSALDLKIDLNQRINTELEEMAKTIYDYWFVQFDFPDEKGQPFKSNGGKMAWNDELKKEIPLEWEVGVVSNIVTNIKEIASIGENSNLPYIPIDNLPMKKLISAVSSPNIDAKSSLVLFKKYDILLGAMRVYFHRVCMAIQDGITRTTVFVLRPKEDYLKYYSLFTINTTDSIGYAKLNSKGTTMPYAFWENGYENLGIVIPPRELLFSFNKIIEPIIEKLIVNELESKTLTELRDWLLPMLMNGQVKVI